MSIDRDGEPHIVNPTSSSELKSGDKINIVVGVSIECVVSLLRKRSFPLNKVLGYIGDVSHAFFRRHDLYRLYQLKAVLRWVSAPQLLRATWG